MKKFLLAAAALVALTTPAHATLITSSAGFADTYDWAQLGPTFTTLNGAQTVTSTLGSTAVVTSAGNVFERRNEGWGTGWAGNFADGTALLWNQGVGPDITISFANPVNAAGAQIQADIYAPFTAQITTFDSLGNILNVFTEAGVSNGNNDNSAIFIGAKDISSDIAKIEFDISSAYYSHDFAIGPVKVSSVPLPAALPLFGMAFGAMGLAARRRKA